MFSDSLWCTDKNKSYIKISPLTDRIVLYVRQNTSLTREQQMQARMEHSETFDILFGIR